MPASRATNPPAPAPAGFDADVIVVGAGPIGLTTGCALRHHGVDCRILEERTETKPNSRANNLWARPQELLASVDLREALVAKSYGVQEIVSSFNGTPIAPIALERVASPYPLLLYSGQDIIESTLIEQFEGRGGVLERGCKVTGLAPDETGVTVTYAREGGGEGRQRARYLVAADGAKSTVRPIVGLDFEPERLEGAMNRQVDARLSWRRSLEFNKIWFFYYERGFLGVLPVWEDYHRLFFLQDDTGVPDRDPTLEELQELGRTVTGDDTLTLSDPIWLNHSRFQYGVSPSYARGRVFLAGDAGHLSLPIGGQGMNAGLHDSVEIAWRLAMTLRGEAEPVVLDSYGDERGGEHARLSDQQVKGFGRAVYRGSVTDAAMGLAAKALPNLSSLVQGTNDLHQIAVHYPDSALNEDYLSGLTHLLQSRGPRAGDRAPDAEVTHEGDTSTLFAHLYNPDGRTTGWALLGFDGRSAEAGASLLEAVRAVAPWESVRPRLVLAGPRLAGGNAPVLSDLDGRAHVAYGLEGQPALILVRPDGHIAYRGAADRADLLSAYCRRIFGERGASSDAGAVRSG